MRCMVCCLVAVAALGRLAVAQDSSSPGIVKVPHCTVALAEQADLPPQEAGVIREIPVKQGDKVEKGQPLLQLDDRKAQKEQEVAEAKYEAALAKAKDDINVRYAIAAAAVAKAELEVNQKSNEDVPGSVSQVRLNELILKCKETELAIEKATLDRNIAAAEARVGKAEVEAAKVMVDRHKVVSPINGVVVDIRAHKGEAFLPTQDRAVIRVVNLDTLWVQGDVSAARYARADLENKKVTVDVVIAHGEKRALDGEIIYVSPLTDTGDSYQVRAKVANSKGWLSPGMQAEMNIYLSK